MLASGCSTRRRHLPNTCLIVNVIRPSDNLAHLDCYHSKGMQWCFLIGGWVGGLGGGVLSLAPTLLSLSTLQFVIRLCSCPRGIAYLTRSCNDGEVCLLRGRSLDKGGGGGGGVPTQKMGREERDEGGEGARNGGGGGGNPTQMMGREEWEVGGGGGGGGRGEGRLLVANHCRGRLTETASCVLGVLNFRELVLLVVGPICCRSYLL